MNQQNAPAVSADQTQLRPRTEGQVLPLQRADRPRAISISAERKERMLNEQIDEINRQPN